MVSYQRAALGNSAPGFDGTAAKTLMSSLVIASLHKQQYYKQTQTDRHHKTNLLNLNCTGSSTSSISKHKPINKQQEEKFAKFELHRQQHKHYISKQIDITREFAKFEAKTTRSVITVSSYP
jgi:hypothetical protein